MDEDSVPGRRGRPRPSTTPASTWHPVSASGERGQPGGRSPPRGWLDRYASNSRAFAAAMLRSRTCFGSSVFAFSDRRHRCGDVLDLLLRGGPALGAGQSLNEMQGEVDAGGDPAGAHQVAVIHLWPGRSPLPPVASSSNASACVMARPFTRPAAASRPGAHPSQDGRVGLASRAAPAVRCLPRRGDVRRGLRGCFNPSGTTRTSPPSSSLPWGRNTNPWAARTSSTSSCVTRRTSRSAPVAFAAQRRPRGVQAHRAPRHRQHEDRDSSSEAWASERSFPCRSSNRSPCPPGYATALGAKVRAVEYPQPGPVGLTTGDLGSCHRLVPRDGRREREVPMITDGNGASGSNSGACASIFSYSARIAARLRHLPRRECEDRVVLVQRGETLGVLCLCPLGEQPRDVLGPGGPFTSIDHRVLLLPGTARLNSPRQRSRQSCRDVCLEAALERASGFPEREDRVDRWAKFAAIGEPCDLDQLDTVGLDDEVDGLDTRLAASSRGGSEATETNRPPLPRRASERSSRSPPTVSKTRSTCPTTSSNCVVVWSITSSAPSSRAVWTFSVEEVPTTKAPRTCASCTAKPPTPPAAPWMSTRSPSRSRRDRTTPATR